MTKKSKVSRSLHASAEVSAESKLASQIVAKMKRDLGLPKGVKEKKNRSGNDEEKGSRPIMGVGASYTSHPKSFVKVLGTSKRKGQDILTISGGEVCATLTGETAANGFSLSNALLFCEEINPANPALFPRLSLMAMLYERFRFKRLRLSYLPSCSSSTAGSIGIALQTDPARQPVTDFVRLMQMEYSACGAPWAPLRTETFSDPREIFTQNIGQQVGISGNFSDGNALVSDSEKRFTSAGYAYAVNNTSSNADFGYLYLEYEVEFIHPIPPPSCEFNATALTNQEFAGGATPGTAYSPLLALSLLAQIGYWGYNLYNGSGNFSSSTGFPSTTGPLNSANSIIVEAAQYLMSYYFGIDAVAAAESKTDDESDYSVVRLKRPVSVFWRHPKLRRHTRRCKFLPCHDEIMTSEPPTPMTAGDVTTSIVLITDAVPPATTQVATVLATLLTSAGTGAITISRTVPIDLGLLLGGSDDQESFPLVGNTTGRVALLVTPTGTESRQISDPGAWNGSYLSVIELPASNANTL